MTPEMVAALKEQFPFKKIRVSDRMFIVKDRAMKQVVIVLEAAGSLYCYHVPTWELPAVARKMLREFGVSGMADWLWIRTIGKWREPKGE